MPDEVKGRKRILMATAAGLFLPSLAWATDARMSYITPAGTTSFKGYTLDSGTITTTATTVDSTFYLTSNAWGTYHVGVGGHLYILDIFGSGAGKRTFMSWRKVQ